MPRSWFLLGIVLWAGATLLLSGRAWFRQPALITRLRPYAGARAVTTVRPGTLSGASVRDVLGPLAAAAGARLSKVLGVNEELSARLVRSGSELDPAAFRLRQATWAGGALLAATLAAVVLGLPAPIATGVVLGAPVLAVLLIEQRVTTASRRWQERVLHELPVVIEQLGMLLSSGYSLGAAINRLGRRGRGACAVELARVAERVRHGVSDLAALREWAVRCDVPAVDRLVNVMALNWEAGDLGALISAEARSVRREVHRAEIEIIEQRSQQVWIPVTVATLVPGVIFMAVPFVDAMGKLTGHG
ncbi:MAG: type II secretion system F family protein [Acidimicrobiales bacterium]